MAQKYLKHFKIPSKPLDSSFKGCLLGQVLSLTSAPAKMHLISAVARRQPRRRLPRHVAATTYIRSPWYLVQTGSKWLRLSLSNIKAPGLILSTCQCDIVGFPDHGEWSRRPNFGKAAHGNFWLDRHENLQTRAEYRQVNASKISERYAERSWLAEVLLRLPS